MSPSSFLFFFCYNPLTFRRERVSFPFVRLFVSFLSFLPCGSALFAFAQVFTTATCLAFLRESAAEAPPLGLRAAVPAPSVVLWRDRQDALPLPLVGKAAFTVDALKAPDFMLSFLSLSVSLSFSLSSLQSLFEFVVVGYGIETRYEPHYGTKALSLSLSLSRRLLSLFLD